MAFTKELKASLKEKMPKLSHHFFTTIYNNDPAALRMFSFIKDKTPPKKNDGELEAHAMKIFMQIFELAVVADNTRKKLDIKKLGFNTLKKGVNKDHFKVVKKALLSTVKEAMGDKWTKEMDKAWGVAYENLVKVITDEQNEASSSR